MDATNPMTPENQQKRADSRRKRKAILAGGVVLGLGAAVTLAAWSDDVFADGLFSTGGVFLLEGSEEAYTAVEPAENFRAAQTEGTPIRLTFTTGTDAAAITPGDTLYAPFSIRLTEESDLDGELLTVTATATGAMRNALQYTITESTGTCADGASNNGPAWVANQAVGANTAVGGTAINLTANDAGTTGDIVPLCVAVTFPDTPTAKNAVDTENIAVDTRVVWEFYGEQD